MLSTATQRATRTSGIQRAVDARMKSRCGQGRKVVPSHNLHGDRSMNAGHPRILLIADTLNFGGTEGQFVEIACGLVSIPVMGRSVRALSLMPEAWKLQGRMAATRQRRLTAWGTKHGGFTVQRILAKEGQNRLPGDDHLRRVVLKTCPKNPGAGTIGFPLPSG